MRALERIVRECWIFFVRGFGRFGGRWGGCVEGGLGEGVVRVL